MEWFEIRDGATAEAAVAALRAVSADAGNLSGVAAGRSPAELLDRYLRWVEKASWDLSNALTADAVADLIQTQEYWVLRSASPDAPRLTPLILNEAEQQRRNLEARAMSLEKARGRWRSAPARLVVPDTNMFLQNAVPFDQIDWPKELDTRQDVRIVVPLVVIHELDRLKRQGNNTTNRMAREALRWLSSHLPSNPDDRSARLNPRDPMTTVEVYVHGEPRDLMTPIG